MSRRRSLLVKQKVGNKKMCQFGKAGTPYVGFNGAWKMDES